MKLYIPLTNGKTMGVAFKSQEEMVDYLTPSEHVDKLACYETGEYDGVLKFFSENPDKTFPLLHLVYGCDYSIVEVME